MKRHVQTTGVRKWAGLDLTELQSEPLRVLDNFISEYGSCILQGCEITPVENGNYNISSGYVALSGNDQDDKFTFKIAPFAGVENVVLPIYLTLSYSVVERVYVDQKVKPIAYDYKAIATNIKPQGSIPCLEISVSGGKRFVDAIGLTEKLSKTGNGKDISVTFAEAVQRGNIVSGERLSTLWGKVQKWFTDLKTVAFSGKASDLSEDATHRFFTDTERMKLEGIAENANKYVHPTSHPGTIIDQDTTHRFVSDSEKTNWNSKAASSHTHQASQVSEETNKHFLTDAERTKIANTYGKIETYTRNEIDTKDTATLKAAQSYVMERISDVIGNSPAALDTLYEIANALGNDPNFATTIMGLINSKAPLVHSHTRAQISDFPASLPASDVYAWAKAKNKPSYTAVEVGAADTNHNHNGVYQPIGSYAITNHNHDATYQPKGNYAPSTHVHSADQISDTQAKVMMTTAERSKLAGIEVGANKYVHPDNHPANMIQQDSTHRFVTDSEKTKWNRAGQCSGSYTNNGYCDLPGGITIQWGRVHIPSGNHTLSFPKKFGSLYSIVITPEDSNTNRTKNYGIDGRTVSGFYISNCEGASFYFNWIAIGKM